MATSASTSEGPMHGRLSWVKLPSTQVFWPACVYNEYNDAIKDGHDTCRLKAAREVLDNGDHIVYFFGVGPDACHAKHSTLVPTLQFCIARADDMTVLPFTAPTEFPQICEGFHVHKELVKRTEKNNCFKSACEEALRVKATAHDIGQTHTLFLTLLVSAKDTHKEHNSASNEANSETIRVKTETDSPSSSPVRVHSLAPRELSARPPFYSPPHSKLSRVLNSSPSPSKKVLPGMEHVVPECWKLMLSDGWETMTVANGHVMFKMPGVSFFDFRPNETIFDSVAKACTKYLSDWAIRGLNNDNVDAKLMDLLWPMVEQNGWSKITTSNETWYMMPNTQFRDCVPNKTVFQSRARVVSRFLADTGLIDVPMDAKATEAAVGESQEEEEEVDMDEAMDVDESHDEEDTDDDTASDNNNDDDSDVVVSTKRAKTASRKVAAKPIARAATALVAKKPTAPAAAVPSSAAKKLTFEPKPSIPPFKCTPGKVEEELRERGWYWKHGRLDWTYFKPHCRLKDLATLTAGEDFFNSRPDLDEYLKVTGLYDDIYDKLYCAHKAMFTESSDFDSDEEAPVARAVKKKVKPAPLPVLPRPTKALKVTANNNDDKENQSSNIKAPVSKKAPSKPKPLKSMTSDALVEPSATSFKRRRGFARTGFQVKFGDVWRVLERQGWYFKSGMFEYDYFKPTCTDPDEGVMGVDYFVSKTLLISYLEASGLWDKIAKQIERGDVDIEPSARAPKAGAAKKGEKKKEELAPTVTTSPVAKRRALIKRKSIERTPQNSTSDDALSGTKPKTKKARVSGSFRTPTEPKRSSAAEDGDESDKAADKISPDTATAKANALESSTLSRNLADCFTPSPSMTKKSKANNVADPRALFSAAIERLTLGHTVSTFQYRDDEAARISAFFQKCFSQRHGSSMYISGAPGCGKSALLKASEAHIEQLYQEAYGTESAQLLVCHHVNAVALNDSNALYSELAQVLTKQSFADGDSAFEAIEKATNCAGKRSKTMVVILDEIDILLKKNGVESDLCRLFELAHRPSHAFILVGIANQVDFTERHLPLLQQQLPQCTPEVVIFKPYAHQTIECILTDRLGGKETALKLLNAHGISFLARKIASTSGDIRLALDICRRVLQHRVDAATGAEDDDSSSSALLLAPVPLTDMLRLVKASLESKSAQVVQALPRTLQMILFASTRLEAAVATATASPGASAGALFAVDELYACYCDVSQDAGVFKPLAFREFRTALETLSSEGLLGAGELKKQFVKLQVAPSELLQSFRNDAYFARLV